MKPRLSILGRGDYHQVYFNFSCILYSPNAFSSFFLPPCQFLEHVSMLYVHACVSTCLYTWTYVCICSWRQEVNIKCLSLLSSSLFWGRVSPWPWASLICLQWLSNKPQGASCYPLPICRMANMLLLFYPDVGIQIQVLTLCRDLLCHLQRPLSFFHSRCHCLALFFINSSRLSLWSGIGNLYPMLCSQFNPLTAFSFITQDWTLPSSGASESCVVLTKALCQSL